MYLNRPQNRTIYSIYDDCQHTISTNSWFPFIGGRGGLPDNDHEFPFAGDVELLRWSLKVAGKEEASTWRGTAGYLAQSPSPY